MLPWIFDNRVWLASFMSLCLGIGSYYIWLIPRLRKNAAPDAPIYSKFLTFSWLLVLLALLLLALFIAAFADHTHTLLSPSSLIFTLVVIATSAAYSFSIWFLRKLSFRTRKRGS